MLEWSWILQELLLLNETINNKINSVHSLVLKLKMKDSEKKKKIC